MLLSMITCAALASFAPLQGDLSVFDADVREVSGEPWFEDVTVLFRSTDYFLGVAAGSTLEASGCGSVICSGPVYLDEYRLVHLRNSGLPDRLAPSVVFLRGDVAVVRGMFDPLAGRAGDVFFEQPLRPFLTRDAGPVSYPGPTDGYVDDMVAAVSEDSIRATIQHLEDYGTRLCVLPEYDQAAQWVESWFDLHWIPSEFQTFAFSGDSMSNVVAEIPGKVHPDQIYIICGHLDSIVWPYEGSAPGADDNGSGSAAVLEAARVMCQYDFEYTVRFICFGAEEVGLVGSQIYADSALASGDDILGVINLDMILYAPDGADSLWIPYDDQSQELAETVLATMNEYAPQLDVVIQYDPSATYSDHSSFWQDGYPAVLGIEYDVDYNPYYHQETDLLANYEEYWPFGTDCVRASVAALATLAVPIGPSGTGGGSPWTGDALLRLSPNPVMGSVTASFAAPSSTEAALTVMDLSGRVVLTSSVMAGEPSVLDLSGLPSGVYAVRWTAGDLSGASRLVLVD
jgi:hypothetical protein